MSYLYATLIFLCFLATVSGQANEDAPLLKKNKVRQMTCIHPPTKVGHDTLMISIHDYDQEGRRPSLQIYEDGRHDHTYVYTYDKDSIVRKMVDVVDHQLIDYVVMQMSGERVTHVAWFSGDGAPKQFAYDVDYNALGQKSVITCHYPDGASERLNFTYHPNGQMASAQMNTMPSLTQKRKRKIRAALSKQAKQFIKSIKKNGTINRVPEMQDQTDSTVMRSDSALDPFSRRPVSVALNEPEYLLWDEPGLRHVYHVVPYDSKAEDKQSSIRTLLSARTRVTLYFDEHGVPADCSHPAWHYDQDTVALSNDHVYHHIIEERISRPHPIAVVSVTGMMRLAPNDLLRRSVYIRHDGLRGREKNWLNGAYLGEKIYHYTYYEEDK